jgi:hypothetical protein
VLSPSAAARGTDDKSATTAPAVAAASTPVASQPKARQVPALSSASQARRKVNVFRIDQGFRRNVPAGWRLP